LEKRIGRSLKPVGGQRRRDLLALEVVALVVRLGPQTALVLDGERLAGSGEDDDAGVLVDLGVVDLPGPLEQVLDRLRRSVVEAGAEHGHRVRVLQQILEVGARGWLVDTPGVDHADLQIVDPQQFGHDEVDAGGERELRVPTVVDALERGSDPLQGAGGGGRTVPLVAPVPSVQTHQGQHFDDEVAALRKLPGEFLRGVGSHRSAVGPLRSARGEPGHVADGALDLSRDGGSLVLPLPGRPTGLPELVDEVLDIRPDVVV
jgi:hypothetical protein